MLFENPKIQAIYNNFHNIESPANSIVIEGNWDSFVKQSYITALRSQINKHEQKIHIVFKNAKISIIFMLLLKDTLESTQIEKVYLYSKDIQVISLTSFVYSSSYDLYCNSIEITDDAIEFKKTQTYQEKKRNPIIQFLTFIGKWAYNYYKSMIAFFNFMGMLLYFFAQSLLQPSNFHIKSLMHHIYEQGFKALPVGLVTCLIIGYAITLQGAYQLNSMGVPIMSVDTTAKLALREMGPFILSLVIAGRSASSFTAQLGSMRLTEELSAMQAMNLNIFHFLVIPRILALIVVMPLMVFAADTVALFGGMIAIKTSVNIGFETYLERFYETVSITHFWIGVVKVPVFGMIIGLVGCFHGLECKGDTQSIGRMTTRSVVNAIFWIIVANAIFSFIFTRYDL
ncbi:MlaE family ABC transporter permease [Helicobacter didelphidarum]|uniref:MlaE family ABC transporter permease n=1 Tax=Helicobacter didelphidarum TaxID=2040648 RepID=UPI001FE60E00|nr:ABC transporter permease [Helicobacter didelphidarum]